MNDRPQFVKGSDTSEDAADSIEGVSEAMRWQVLRAIRGELGRGMNDDEIERALGMRHQTASARRRELVKEGYVVDSGKRRETSSGRTAIVWVVPEWGPPQDEGELIEPPPEVKPQGELF